MTWWLLKTKDSFAFTSHAIGRIVLTDDEAVFQVCSKKRNHIYLFFRQWRLVFRSLAQGNAVVQPALTTYNTEENNCSISHAQNATLLPPNKIFNGKYQWLVTKNQNKKLPSSTENSSVNISGFALLHLARF